MARLLLLVGVVVSGCAAEPPLTSHTQAIAGGAETSSHAYPSVVAVRWNASAICTGTLVTRSHIVTAAHCATAPAEMYVEFGTNDLGGDEPRQRYEVRAATIHPAYRGTLTGSGDLAILELTATIAAARPTPIYPRPIPNGQQVTLVGYGRPADDGVSGTLRHATKPTVACEAVGVRARHAICFDATDGVAACKGDSGGPGYVSVEGTRYVVSAASYGTSPSCVRGADVHSALARELPFLTQHLPQAAFAKLTPQAATEADAGALVPSPELATEASAGGCATHANTSIFMIALARLRRRGRRAWHWLTTRLGRKPTPLRSQPRAKRNSDHLLA